MITFIKCYNINQNKSGPNDTGEAGQITEIALDRPERCDNGQ